MECNIPQIVKKKHWFENIFQLWNFRAEVIGFPQLGLVLTSPVGTGVRDSDTLPETNQNAPENGAIPKGKSSSFPIHFQVRTVSLREGNSTNLFNWNFPFPRFPCS